MVPCHTNFNITKVFSLLIKSDTKYWLKNIGNLQLVPIHTNFNSAKVFYLLTKSNTWSSISFLVQITEATFGFLGHSRRQTGASSVTSFVHFHLSKRTRAAFLGFYKAFGTKKSSPTPKYNSEFARILVAVQVSILTLSPQNLSPKLGRQQLLWIYFILYLFPLIYEMPLLYGHHMSIMAHRRSWIYWKFWKYILHILHCIHWNFCLCLIHRGGKGLLC